MRRKPSIRFDRRDRTARCLSTLEPSKQERATGEAGKSAMSQRVDAFRESCAKPIMLRIAFMASNNGSSFVAIVRAIEAGELDAVACLVVSNRSAAPALAFANQHSIAFACIPTQGVEHEADRKLLEALTAARADLVVLSGYLKKLGPMTLAAFAGRILNVHPALLPRFGGHGMYGRRVHQAVVDARETITGATIHLVDQEYDQGRIVASRETPIEPADDINAIERKVMQAECSLFIDTLRRIAAGQLQLPR